jgi:hypothetical protein
MLMAKSETIIPTAFASRYLQQLCKHWGHKFTVEFTPEQGEIPFGPGRVLHLKADGANLRLILEFDEADALPRMQGVVIEHLKRFSHKEELGEPVWTRVEEPAA